MTHDLGAILAEVLALFPGLPPVRITWAPAAELAEGEHWAQWRRLHDGAQWIGVLDSLQRAPRYVLVYLVGHEVLHVALPPHGACCHHRAFRVAERLLPHYARASAWLERHA
jgi:hypothetical protein